MAANTEIQLWLVNSMLILGTLVFVLGLWIMIAPSSFLRTGKSLSKWVTTDEYFDYLDKPRYQERLIYKHHRVAGTLILLCALYTLVMLLLKVDPGNLPGGLPVIVNRVFSEWLYGTLYYLLLAANVLAVAAGAVIFARPSLLKGIEITLNKWIVSDKNLRKLDEAHEISLEVLPGNPRLFGLAVTLGGLYIMLSMGVVLL